tara:strand:+ start:43 stop:510 length:468 start_codon:yes stop_codon:yes gene_type:complete
MNFAFKNHKNFILMFFLIILISCKLQEPSKNHGILFLENRAEKLSVSKSNKNDVFKIFGYPHSKYINDENTWIYIERVLTKGQYHKLGKNVLKTNNILVLKFDKYGILKEKELLDKFDKKKLKFSKSSTKNEITQKSFVESFLSSIREKMYSNKK